MSNYPVTIALSVYNIAEYVRASLDCILAQTFKDFELLCIDDASTDRTWEILQEYAAKDGRIRLLRQKTNQGLSVSRNLAIAEAQGDYLLMLDGDDLFAHDMVEKAYNKAIETDADMVMWDYAVFYQESDLDKKRNEVSGLMNVFPKDKLSLLRRPAFVWVRLLKMDAIRSLGIYFTPGLTKQDIPIHWKLITSLDRISLIPEKLSFYRQQPNSTTNRKGPSMYSLAYVMDLVEKQLKTDGIYQTYKDEFLFWRITCLYGMCDSISPEFRKEALEKVKERLGEDEMAYLSNPKNELSSRLKSFYQMIQGNRWAEFRYKWFRFVRAIYRKIKRS